MSLCAVAIVKLSFVVNAIDDYVYMIKNVVLFLRRYDRLGKLVTLSLQFKVI